MERLETDLVLQRLAGMAWRVKLRSSELYSGHVH